MRFQAFFNADTPFHTFPDTLQRRFVEWDVPRGSSISTLGLRQEAIASEKETGAENGDFGPTVHTAC